MVGLNLADGLRTKGGVERRRLVSPAAALKLARELDAALPRQGFLRCDVTIWRQLDAGMAIEFPC